MVVESEGKIRGNIQENLTNILVVKAFSKEKNKKNLLKLLQKQNYWCIIRKNKLGISVNSLALLENTLVFVSLISQCISKPISALYLSIILPPQLFDFYIPYYFLKNVQYLKQ